MCPSFTVKYFFVVLVFIPIGYFNILFTSFSAKTEGHKQEQFRQVRKSHFTLSPKLHIQE